MDIVYIVLGLVLLILGGDWLLKSSVGLSLKLEIPKIIIGMTVVSFATSAPELIVSIKSALNGYTDLAVGNVVGSNIANIALVLGLTICLCTITVKKSFYTKDWLFLAITSTTLFFCCYFDAFISRIEGIILFGLLIAYLVYSFKFNKEETEEDENIVNIPNYKIAIFLILGSIALYFGSEFLIDGATNLAKQLGVSERVIGVTVVSIGTSIPELAASIIAVIKKEKAISLGNLIGSNIFNILAVLGITAIIQPIKINDSHLLTNDLFWMLGIAFGLSLLAFIPKKNKLSLKEGLLLLAVYGLFVYKTIM